MDFMTQPNEWQAADAHPAILLSLAVRARR
jgi:hypothetical protein